MAGVIMARHPDGIKARHPSVIAQHHPPMTKGDGIVQRPSVPQV